MTVDNFYKPLDKLFAPSDKLFASLRLAMVSVALLFVVGCMVIWATSDSPKKAVAISDSHLSAKELASLQTVVESFGEVPFFGSDLQEIHQSVLKLSWVESAKVSRDWYQGISVAVTPRKAVANFGSGQMVDANGVVFVPADKNALMNSKLVSLGGQPEQAVHIMNQMQRINTWFAPLGISVKDLILAERQTWIATFDNGFSVIVDHENTEQKLYRLSLILNGEYKETLPNIERVDLRYKDGLVIKLKDTHL